jgi:hypothetical protein
VKLVVPVQLLPSPAQAAALRATLTLVNQAANLVSQVAWDTRCFGNYALRKHTYTQLKALGLSRAVGRAGLLSTSPTRTRTPPPATLRELQARPFTAEC